MSHPEMLLTTPNKRKRETANKNNASFVVNKENNFLYNGFMETKSINDLINPSTTIPASKISDNNQFEILRKPPKKKKKHNSTDACCFINEALNLNGPENPLNPFEIRRTSNSVGIPNPNGFFNPALNLAREPGNYKSNPFEIARQPIDSIIDSPAASTQNGKFILLVENNFLSFILVHLTFKVSRIQH